jgi:hypothetical protein
VGTKRATRFVVGKLDGDEVAVDQAPAGTAPRAVDVDAATGHEAGGLRTRDRQLISEEPVEPLGGRGQDLKGDGIGQEGSPVRC